LSWLAVGLGVMLGFGGLLIWQGLRTVINRDLADADRRKGFWRLNAGLVLVAASVIAFGQAVRG
jgi:hypothetical protein